MMAFTFKATGYSTNGLLMMHEGIKKAHSEDTATPEGQDKPYGVYEHQAWKIQSDEIEAELRSRGKEFEPIPWLDN